MPRHLRTRPHLWRIDRLHGAGADYLGIIVAPNAEAAIEQACKKFGISEPAPLTARELPRGRNFPVRDD
jgi:hypothetical protein